MRRPRKPLLVAFPEAWGWTRRIALLRDLPMARVALHEFPDRETLVRVPETVPAQAIVVQRLHDPNEKLFPLLLAADALRRVGAERVTLVAPYLPYMRQDAVFRRGEPVSQRVLGHLLRSGFDRVLTIEAHLHRIERLSEVVPGLSLSAAPAIAAYLSERRWQGCLAGPDAESARWVEQVGRAAGLPWLVGRKERRGDRRVSVEFDGPLPARDVMLVDDIASSGATLARAARVLRRLGARRVEAVVVHAIFSPGAVERLKRAGIERVVSCDTVPHPTNRISCAEIVAEAL
ncbi:MAG: phosphoribosylpyrophosphate synthetase [Candidatus Binatia bacterium]|nr:MAG: phosphoribosylpyrophosphate synthetase [Candidatus Binatia bacterium]